jgi:aminopeptidase
MRTKRAVLASAQKRNPVSKPTGLSLSHPSRIDPTGLSLAMDWQNGGFMVHLPIMSIDPRVQQHARVLAHYSLAAQPREVITIDGPPAAEPLIVAAHEELLRAGAFPAVRMTPEACLNNLFRSGKPHHFDEISPLDRATVRAIDGTIRIMAATNTRALSDVKPAQQARIAKATRALRQTLLKKKWVLTLHPTAAYAQDADMSLTTFENFVYAAVYADTDNAVKHWKAAARRQAKLIAALHGADQFRIVGPDTDLTLSIKNRTFINSCGKHNMPCGEIFTGPIENSAEGHIRYDYPVVHAGREIDGIRLVFHKGRVVEAAAEKNEAFLLQMLDMDPGARRLGELGIGTHYGIKQFIKNILFDEKIGGTIHLALGQSYAETGGKNNSALHWDMIKDLRRGGALYVDGKLFQKNGRFV